jgi:hypothetical protein
MRVGVKRFHAATRLLQAEVPLQEYVEDEEDSDSDRWSGAEGTGGDGDDHDGDGKDEFDQSNNVRRAASESSDARCDVHASASRHHQDSAGRTQAACITVDVVGTVTLWHVVHKVN